MADYLHTLMLDAVTITVINMGDFQAPYADEWSNLSPSELATQDTANLRGSMPVKGGNPDSR